MNAKTPMIAKQKKESEFLKQKAGHYQKLASSMIVCYVVHFLPTTDAIIDGCHFI